MTINGTDTPNLGSNTIAHEALTYFHHFTYQVAPAELEDILLSHPDVDDAAVVGLPDEMAGECPFAFIVRKANSSVSERQLQDFVAGE